jgi:NADH dehydrogenase
VQPKLSELVLQQCNDKMDLQSLSKVFDKVLREHPKSDQFVDKLRDFVTTFDGKEWSLDDVKEYLDKAEGKTTSLPATAQVASQQGAYLGNLLNQLGRYEPEDWAKKEANLPPFRYRHLGNFAYVGGTSAVLDLGKGHNVGGFGGFFLWRSAYLSKQVSFRTRVLLAWDWTKTIIFGRDISKI